MDFWVIDKPFKLNKPFKTRGLWWSHDTPERQVPGVLRFSPKSIRLDLEGTLTEMTTMEVLQGHFAQTKDLEFACVHGRARSGERFTLLKVIPSYGFSSGAPPNCVCHVQTLLACCQTPSNDLTVRRFHLNLDGLDRFACFEPIQQRKIKEFGDEFCPFYVPEEVSVRIDSIGTTLRIGTEVRRSSSSTKAVLRGRTELTLTPDEPKPLEWCSATMDRLCQWFTMILDRAITPKYVLLDMCDDHMGWFLHATRWSSNGSIDIPVFKLNDLKERMPAMLNAWFSATGSLLSGIHLYVDEKGGQYTLEGRLIVLTQALEAFCRATFTSEYMTVEDYQKVRSHLNESIPKDVSSDHRNALKKKIEYGYEHSLRKRLTTLLGSLRPETVGMVCQSPKDFVAGVVDTRNYFTHYTDELRSKALDHLDLYWACEKLSLLLRICLLKWMGLDEEVIAKTLKMLKWGRIEKAKEARERMPQQ